MYVREKKVGGSREILINRFSCSLKDEKVCLKTETPLRKRVGLDYRRERRKG